MTAAPEVKDRIEERATEIWAIIYSGLVKDGVKFPNNFDGIGAAYGGYTRLIEALTTTRKEAIEEFVDSMLADMRANTPKELTELNEAFAEGVNNFKKKYTQSH